MTSVIQSSDLPPSVKTQLLNEVRSQVGDHSYERMVSVMGEDGVVDAILNYVSSSGSTNTAPSSAPSPWGKAWEVVTSAFLSFGGLNWLFIAISGGWGGIAAVLGIFVLLYLGVAFFHAIGVLNALSTGLAWVFGIAVGGVAVVGIGYGLWIGVPWLLSGVGQWWGWLGAHFK